MIVPTVALVLYQSEELEQVGESNLYTLREVDSKSHKLTFSKTHSLYTYGHGTMKTAETSIDGLFIQVYPVLYNVSNCT